MSRTTDLWLWLRLSDADLIVRMGFPIPFAHAPRSNLLLYPCPGSGRVLYLACAAGLCGFCLAIEAAGAAAARYRRTPLREPAFDATAGKSDRTVTDRTSRGSPHSEGEGLANTGKCL
jgi:hypothetical protein